MFYPKECTRDKINLNVKNIVEKNNTLLIDSLEMKL